ncbi:hypothetical protein TNIN_274831 [Trichonephila inaurata madagascariensis]|uniref:Uncharacterized protein n=1 Tax=Trichonephila inaurata madagascariensis TaxID=2747483 RepID=A0A8X6WMC8_9ARAC|nr:hypothetical protein TNIN_274831 [Trichonephila inaurata madagascariensis]
MPMKDNDIELGQSKPTAIRRLKRLERRRFVREPDTKMSNFYKNMRICITCRADDITTAKKIHRQLIGLMKEGCFHLYKWSANCEELLKDVPTENKEYLFNENMN